MHRPPYGQSSPPLHHPVPQHVSTVPQLRSPPPPAPMPQHPSSGPYGSSPYPQQQGVGGAGGPGGGGMGGGNAFGGYGNFINDPTAQFAAHFGQTAFKQGQDYVEQNVSLVHAQGRAAGVLARRLLTRTLLALARSTDMSTSPPSNTTST